jgi:mycothiol synthase
MARIGSVRRILIQPRTETILHSFSAAGLSIRVALPGDLEAIRRFLPGANEAPYDLAAVAREKCFGPGITGPPVTLLAVGADEEIHGVVVTCGEAIRILAVGRAVRRRGIGGALLAAAEEPLGRKRRIVIAAEAGNYFTPGVVEGDEETLLFLQHRGYERSDETDNLAADVSSLEAIPSSGPEPGLPFRASHSRRAEALAWIERQFGRIWRFESEPAFDRDEPTMFLVENEGAIAGFAAHDANNRGLGFFGPTGVSRQLRGRGLGRLLLMASLADLRSRGFSRVIIPWTDSLEFYRKSCGALPEHHFVQLTKSHR